MMVAEAVREIAGIARAQQKKVEKIDARDRVYLVNQDTGDVVEVEPRREDNAAHLDDVRVVLIRSIIDWSKAFDTDVVGEVRLSRRGDSFAVAPRFKLHHERREAVSKPFFSEFLPPSDWCSLEAFLSWIDRIRPGMSEETRELVDVAFGAVSATSSQVVEMSVDGAIINVDVRSGDKVVGKRQLPRTIQSVVPFGDPAHQYGCRFVVSARIKDGTVAFRAVHDPNDGAYDSWVAWAESQLRAHLPEGWVVLVTP